MIWSAQQEAALQKVNQWRKSSSEPYFMLAGYAGTGKTTLAKHLAANEDGLVLFAAYTGKAAHVLRKTGIKNVSTIHQLIYRPRTKCDARFRDLKARHARLLHRDPVPEAERAEVEKELKAERDNLKRPDFTLKTDSPLSKARLLVIDEYSMIDRRMGEDLLYSGCPILALGDPGAALDALAEARQVAVGGAVAALMLEHDEIAVAALFADEVDPGVGH